MKSFYETIYLKSPAFIQNVALSLYGLKLNRIRYGGNYQKYVSAIEEHINLTPEQIKSIVLFNLKRIVTDAFNDVPYYRKSYAELGININDISCLSDIQLLPLIDKDSIRRSPDDFISEKYRGKKLMALHTTGSTGKPLNISCNEAARQMNFAFFDRFLQMSGIKKNGKRATFWGRLVVHSDQTKPPFWRYSVFQKNLMFSSYHMTDENMPFYIRKLIEFKPDYIDAYSSSVFTIADYAKRNKINLKGVAGGITTSAETLFKEQREVIESVFDVPVIDQYGAAEMCLFVGQCPEGNYHIHSDYGIVEIVDDNGKNVGFDEEGEVVCTGFINNVMPLIRYRIGDRGILSSEKCTCGSPFPVMGEILGRMDDYILTADGRKIGRLSPVLKGSPVKEAQYVQLKSGAIEVNIVKDVMYTEKNEMAIRAELEKRIGTSNDIYFKYVEKINRGAGGKLRSVISYYK